MGIGPCHQVGVVQLFDRDEEIVVGGHELLCLDRRPVSGAHRAIHPDWYLDLTSHNTVVETLRPMCGRLHNLPDCLAVRMESSCDKIGSADFCDGNTLAN